MTRSMSGTFDSSPSIPIRRFTMICWCWRRRRARTAFYWISFLKRLIHSNRRSFVSFIPSYQVTCHTLLAVCMSSDAALGKHIIFHVSHSCRRLCASRRCNLHGTVDKAGLEFSVHSRSSHHADIGHTSERKSPNSIWSNESELSLLYFSSFCVIASSHSPLIRCKMQGQYSLARAQQSFKSLVQIHEKNGKQKIAVKFLIKQKM